MTAINPHTWQPFVPVDYSAQQLPTVDPITKYLYKIGQVGPATERRWAMQHGRFLAGFGSNETQPAYDMEPDSYTRGLEKDDDVYGSGIFDAYGRKSTINPDMGVFQDHPSVPGYINREIQFTVSPEVADITSGADVVVVPGGGLTYQEKVGFPAPFDRIGPTPNPPQVEFAPYSSRQDVFMRMTPQGRVHPTFNPGPTMPIMPPPGGSHGPFPGDVVPAGMSYPVGPVLRSPQVPFSTQWDHVGSQNISQVADLIQSVPGPGIPPSPMSGYNRRRAYGDDATTPVAPAATTDTGTGWGTYVVTGLLVGVAGSLIYGAMKARK